MPDMETCSWCSDEVEDAALTEQPDGARVCPNCVAEEEMTEAEWRRDQAERSGNSSANWGFTVRY